MASRFAASPGFMDAYNSVSGLGVNFNALGNASQASRSKQNVTAMDSVAKLHDAENKAEVIEAGGALAAQQMQAQGNQALAGGIMDGISGFPGGMADAGMFGGSSSPGLLSTTQYTPSLYDPSRTIGNTGMTPSQILTDPNLPNFYSR